MSGVIKFLCLLVTFFGGELTVISDKKNVLLNWQFDVINFVVEKRKSNYVVVLLLMNSSWS